jgi:predicted GIY-YIG superfamily endonuclease
MGVTYLIHFDRPYYHARHYVGTTQDLDARLDLHRRGDGARLLDAVNQAGIGWSVARTWTDGMDTYQERRAFELRIKRQKKTRLFCPSCALRPREMK